MRARIVRLACLGLMMSLVATCATRANDVPIELETPRVSYTYDDLGRLASVTDASGRSAVYRYDGVGNIVGIERSSSSDGGTDGGGSSPREAPAPTITGLSANVVAPGDNLTIEGRRFAEEPVLDAVLFGGAIYGRVDSATETALEVTVPPLAPAGRVSVSTPVGTAKSQDELFVAPAGVDPDDVTFADRVRLGRSKAVTLGGESSVALLSFRGTASPQVEVRLPADAEPYALCQVGVGLVGPDGNVLREADDFAIACEDNRLELPRLPAKGSYTLILAPDDDAPEQLRFVVDEVDPDAPPPEQEDDEDVEEAAEERGENEPAEVELPPELDLELLEPPVLEDPGASAAPGGVLDGAAAFPVDLTTGQAAFLATDVSLPGPVPLAVSRGYKATGDMPSSLDTGAFGLGADLDLHLELRTTPGFQFAEIQTANGIPVVGFVRTSDGVEAEDAVFEHRATPSLFYGARVTWNGNGWDLALADGTTMVFSRKRNSALSAIRDRNGNQITIQRELDDRGRPQGKVLSAISADGGWLQFDYDEEERIIEVANHLGQTVSYSYDAPDWRGRLATVTGPDGSSVAYGYDDENRLVAITGPGGVVAVTNEFDGAGRVTRQVLGDGSVFSFVYTTDAEGRVTQTDVVDPSGLVRRLVVESGQWVSDTWAVGTAQETAVRVERDPTSHFVTAVVGPDGRRDTFGYDSAGNMVSSTSAEESPSPFGTEFVYSDGIAQLEAASDSAGQQSSYRYDDAGNLTAQVDAYGGEIRYRYDRSGRLVRVTDPAGNTTRIASEGAHRVTVTDPAGNSRSEFYDSAGRLAVVTDASDNQSRLTYDDADRVVSVADAAGGETRFSYDPVGNLATVADAAGNTTTYGYDAAGRVTSRTDPAGATDSYSYDTAGNVVAYTDRRGVQSTFTYDGFGRQTGAAFGVGPAGAESTVSYVYDPAGRLVEVTDSLYGTVRLAYDDLDRLVSEASTSGEIRYSYDDAGRRTSTAVADGPETTYAYDDSGLLRSIRQGSDAAVSFDRDELGRAGSVSLPNDVSAGYEYDSRGLLTETDYGEAGRVGYRYDAAGRRLADLGDLAGTELPDAVSSTSHGAGNRLTEWSGSELVYDAAGNLVSDGDSTYSWDARGQLVTVDGPVPATFTYDPFGRRATKTIDGTTTTYLYDGANVLQETTGADPPVTYLTGFAPDQIYARTDGSGDGGGTTTSYLRDGLGSVVGLVGESGRIDTRYGYDPFGATTVDGDEDPNPFAFTGRESDETGLYYYRSRYYDPGLGRFLSEDPIGFAAGDPNLYAYVGNNPTNLVDPSGQQAFTCVGPALDLFLQAMRLYDQLLLLWQTPGITEEQVNIGTDNVLHQVDSARSAFYIACGAEIFIVPGLSAVLGRGLSWFGRTPTGQRLATAVTTHFPTTSARVGLALPAGGRAAQRRTPVNAVGGTHNCASCVIAGDATLAGNPASAVNFYPGKPIPNALELIENYAGSRWWDCKNNGVIPNLEETPSD